MSLTLCRWFALFSALLLAPSVLAQSTVVSGTITDSNSVAWTGATVTAVFQPAPNTPGPYIWSGGAYNPAPAPVTADGSAAFTITLPSNTSISPAGSTWQFSICPAATSPCGVVNLPITGSTQNISSQITAAIRPITVAATAVPRAYNTAEIITGLNSGGLFYDVTAALLKLWNGTMWAAVGGGSGGTTTVVNSTTADTVTSVNSACGSTFDCIYNVNPITGNPTFTLAGDVAFNSNITLQFQDNGTAVSVLTTNGSGHTLTIPHLTQTTTLKTHFAGDASLTIFSNTRWEWFGAVANGVYSVSPTGTDNTAAINAARLATASGYCFSPGQNGFYRITGPITITTAGSQCMGDPTVTRSLGDAFSIGLGLFPVLMNTSTTTNSVEINLGTTSFLNSPVVQEMAIVYPNLVSSSGTATCVYDNYTEGLVIRDIACMDAIYGFHHVASANAFMNHAATIWGDGIVTAYTSAYTTLYGDFQDSTGGQPSDSIRYQDVGYVFGDPASSSGAVGYGIISKGSALNDENIYAPTTFNLQHAISFIYTGTGGDFASSDIHVMNANIQCGGIGVSTGISFDGLVAANSASMVIDESVVGSCTTGILVNNSSGLQVTATQLEDDGVGIEADGSTALDITAVSVNSTDASLLLNNSTAVKANITTSTTGSGKITTAGISLTNGSVSNDVHSNCTSYVTNCIIADSTSYNNLASASASGGHVTNLSVGIAALNSSSVPTSAVGEQLVQNGAAGANTLGRMFNSGANGSLPAGCVQIAGQQFHCVMNAYYDGINWRYINNGPASDFFSYTDGSADGWAVQFAPSGSAGAVITWTPYLAAAANRKGTFTCSAGGSVTISNSNYLATSDVVITMNTVGGTPGPWFYNNTTPGTGFAITCSTLDTSVYNYNIIN